MLLRFEQRLSDSPFVERVWRSSSRAAGAFYSMAEPNLELVVARVGEAAPQVILRGPVTRASVADCPADGEWLGIRLRIGAFMSDLPTAALVDHRSLVLPSAGDGRFWLGDRSWEIPSFETAECLAARLAAAGVIAREGVVEAALAGCGVDIGLRSTQRRFLRAAGITREAFRQIERARHAAWLLRGGAPVLDVVDAAGYFDQPHLTRALRRLIGPTPGGLAHGQDQLSLLYNTAPPLRA
jgi:Helix-turn-helix domain